MEKILNNPIPWTCGGLLQRLAQVECSHLNLFGSKMLMQLDKVHSCNSCQVKGCASPPLLKLRTAWRSRWGVPSNPSIFAHYLHTSEATTKCAQVAVLADFGRVHQIHPANGILGCKRGGVNSFPVPNPFWQLQHPRPWCAAHGLAGEHSQSSLVLPACGHRSQCGNVQSNSL